MSLYPLKMNEENQESLRGIVSYQPVSALCFQISLEYIFILHLFGNMENHDIELHACYLRQIYRICRGRTLTKQDKQHKRSEILCSSKAADILLLFGINVCHDIPGIHSECICFNCCSRIKNFKKKLSDSIFASARAIVAKNKDAWVAYNPDVPRGDCGVCSSFRIGRFESKPKDVPVVSSLHSTSVVSDAQMHAAEVGLSFETETECSIDDDIISTSATNHPPVSSTPLKEKTALNVSNISLIETNSLIETRDVKTSTEILKSSSSEPLDAEEEAVLAHLIRRKLNNSSDDFF